MFYLSWVVGIIAVAVLPLFILPGRLVGRRLQRLLRESMQLDAQIGSFMDERFNVAGALLVKLFGDPAAETRVFNGRAGRVRNVGVLTAVYRTDAAGQRHPAGVAGDRRRLRDRWRLGDQRGVPDRHSGGAGDPAGPALRADQPAIQRAVERDDGTGIVRPALRGAGPETADHRASGGSRAAQDRARRGPGDRIRERLLPLSGSRGRVADVAGDVHASGAAAQGRRRVGAA